MNPKDKMTPEEQRQYREWNRAIQAYKDARRAHGLDKNGYQGPEFDVGPLIDAAITHEAAGEKKLGRIARDAAQRLSPIRSRVHPGGERPP